MPNYNNGLFIFTRDLRIQDNNGLKKAVEMCRNVYTVFFFTPEQVSSSNKFKSVNAIKFMIESLESLSKNIEKKGGKLITFYGKPDECLTTILTQIDIDAVFINKDVTKYSKTRMNEFNAVCKRHEKDIHEVEDFYLTEPGSIVNTSGSYYMKFTPYYDKITALLRKGKISIPHPSTPNSLSRKLKSRNQKFGSKEITLDEAMRSFTKGSIRNVNILGGREQAIQKLRNIHTQVPQYEATRNDLHDRTTQLSAYIKFGNVSIREVYYAFSSKLDNRSATSLIRQLFWRDFYAQIMDNNPDVLFGPMRQQYGKIKWSNSKRLLDAWEKGRTGFPIVDAGMRELLASGYMHNRARLICGSFLPKTLLINWQKGEAHFARNLIDYDPASNNGNWQWVAGTGSDSQPYFRILNPFRQSKKYDPEALYIKRWVPELQGVSVSDIHNWDEVSKDYPEIKYPSPIVDFSEQKEKVLKAYSSV